MVSACPQLLHYKANTFIIDSKYDILTSLPSHHLLWQSHTTGNDQAITLSQPWAFSSRAANTASIKRMAIFKCGFMDCNLVLCEVSVGNTEPMKHSAGHLKYRQGFHHTAILLPTHLDEDLAPQESDSTLLFAFNMLLKDLSYVVNKWTPDTG